MSYELDKLSKHALVIHLHVEVICDSFVSNRLKPQSFLDLQQLDQATLAGVE